MQHNREIFENKLYILVDNYQLFTHEHHLHCITPPHLWWYDVLTLYPPVTPHAGKY